MVIGDEIVSKKNLNFCFIQVVFIEIRGELRGYGGLKVK